VRAIFLTEQAEVFDRHGMFDRAITRYQEALKVEPNYGRAWEALAKANWRSGNASETIKAATEAVRHNLNADEMWTLLAQGMVVEERQSAVKKYRVLSAEFSSQLPAMDAMKGVEWCGLRIYAGEKIEQVFPDYLNMLGGGLGARPYAQMQRRMAWWLYRAGRLEEALVELDAAKQRFPQGLGPEIDEAWVLADIGRYADAEKRLLGKGESGTVVMVTPENFSRREGENDTTEARGWALTAIINWKTDRREQANSAFKRAAELDPVWMVAKWVANNYSTEAAAVIAKLQAEELARRKKEEIRRNAAGNR
jgi:tetratricopeptide (TPR) repeat protein